VTHPAPGLGMVSADRRQLGQVLLNLVVNSRDAMPRGGRIDIATASVELDDSYASQHFEVTPGSYVMLAVSDTGQGMTEEVREHIFEPFFTTKEEGKGTGLGLSTVYGIVRQSGGTIWVYSEPGEGTTFKIYLPVIPDAVPTRRSEGDPVRAERPASETILLVEDETSVRRIAERVLSTVGYRVITAATGAEALEQCARHDGQIHLLLTDVVMPGMSGPELARQAAALRPMMRIVFMSGYSDEAVLSQGRLAPGSRFLGKPFSVSSLTRSVRDVLDG
jgi:CheY-like chemotaxis protein